MCSLVIFLLVSLGVTALPPTTKAATKAKNKSPEPNNSFATSTTRRGLFGSLTIHKSEGIGDKSTQGTEAAAASTPFDLDKVHIAVEKETALTGPLIDDRGGTPTSYPLQLCQGDCDNDDHCQGDLICMERDGDAAVPGCGGAAVTNHDYCVINPSELPMRKVGTTDELVKALEQGVHIIVLQPGIYRLSAPLRITQDVAIWAEPIDSSACVHSARPPSVWLDGQGSTGVLEIGVGDDASSSLFVELHGINIRSGFAEGGGGVLIEKGNVNFNACQIYNNKASSSGGGGVRISGGTVNFNACQIYNNEAAYRGGHGGAVRVVEGATANFNACQIYNNIAAYGGGISAPASTVHLNGCQIYNNEALSFQGWSRDGGGAYLSPSTVVKVSEVEMWGNSPNHYSGQGSWSAITKELFGFTV